MRLSNYHIVDRANQVKIYHGDGRACLTEVYHSDVELYQL